MHRLDETAAEKDFRIKLGFGSWVYLVWAYLGTVAAIGLLLVAGSLCARGVSGGLAVQRVITPEFLYSTQVFISQAFTVLTVISCLTAVPVAIVLRTVYRRRLLARAGVALPKVEVKQAVVSASKKP